MPKSAKTSSKLVYQQNDGNYNHMVPSTEILKQDTQIVLYPLTSSQESFRWLQTCTILIFSPKQHS